MNFSGEGDPIACAGRHLEALARLYQARIELAWKGWASQLERAKALADEPAVTANGDDEQRLRRVERALWRVSRWVPGASCIHRALAAQRMLRRRGFQSEVVIGLRRGDEEIEGHAWIEVRHGDRLWRAFWDDRARYSVVA